MRFRALQDNLRKALWGRIEAGDLTGLRLAEQTGFKQAHISNFLNRKRGLSLEGMDKVLNVQHLSVLDLLDPAEVNKRASIMPPSDDEFESVAVVEPAMAAEPLIMSMHVKEILKFKKTFLKRLREGIEGDRASWERFVIVRVDAREALNMTPRLIAGATVLLDRHYNTLAPYRRGENNIYAVRKEEGCTFRYVELINHQLVLRPHNPAQAVDVITMEAGTRPGHYVLGRVCYVGMEM
jgi:hypothetical protein